MFANHFPIDEGNVAPEVLVMKEGVVEGWKIIHAIEQCLAWGHGQHLVMV